MHSILEIEAAQRPFKGQSICGDAFHVMEGSTTTIAIVDGLGHGKGAADASAAFLDFFCKNVEKSLDSILLGSSEAMSRTRGAVAALIRIVGETKTLSFCGVGNIELKAKSYSHITPVSMPGILGRKIRKLVVFEYDLSPGDILVAFTDGISSRFNLDDFVGLSIKDMPNEILLRHGKHHDDATCVAFKVLSTARVDQMNE